MWKIGIWPKNFIGAAILVLQNENFFQVEKLKFPTFKLYTVSCYITKGIQPIFKNFFAERCGK